MKARTPIQILLLAAIATSAATAATTQVVRDDSFETLQNGELDGMALSSDGYLYPANERKQAGDTGAEIIWSALEQADKPGILCATGHKGKLVRLLEGGEKKELADLEEPELTAMAELGDGTVLVAASPSARIYKLGADDKLTSLTQLDAKFIWDIEVDANGAAWVATGDEGRLYKVTSAGAETKAELVHEFKSKNLLDLWIDKEGLMGEKGVIFVGAQNPGWLYRFHPDGKIATVALNPEGDEVRAIQPTAEGLALAVNAERAPTAQALQITLRMGGGNVSGGSGGGEEGNAPQKGGPQGTKPAGDVFAASAKKPAGGPASQVILLNREGFAKPLWTSPERPIHSIAAGPGGNLIVAAGGKGRLFELLPKEAFAMIADVQEDYIVRIAPAKEGFLLAGARNGVVYRMNGKPAKAAVYRSRIIDAGTPVRWGRFYWSGDAQGGPKVEVSFRKGNTDDPEAEQWEEWSADAPIGAEEGVKIAEAPSRYMQYRLTVKQGESEAALRTDYVEAFYSQVNRAPQFKSVAASDGAARRPSTSPPTGGEGGGGSAEGIEAGGGSTRGSSPLGGDAAAQGGGRKVDSNAKNINLTWLAVDPNGDQLVYEVYYKAADEDAWKLVEDELKITRLPLGVNSVADGRYRFKVVASDALDNAPGTGLKAEMISDEVVIDNTAPEIEGLAVEAQGNKARVKFKAKDGLSFISSIMADLDGGDSYPIFPEDGFFDAREESVDWTTLKLEKGEHTLTINVTDRRGNSAARKTVFKTTE